MVSTTLSRIRRLLEWMLPVGGADEVLTTEPAPRSPTIAVSAIAIACAAFLPSWDYAAQAVVSTGWLVAIGAGTFITSTISRMGMGGGMSTSSSWALGVASTMVFGPRLEIIIIVVAGALLSDLRVPHLTGGRIGALYNASTEVIQLALTGIVVDALRGLVHDVLAYLIGAAVYFAVNVIAIAPGLLGWRGMASVRNMRDLGTAILLPVSELFAALTTASVAAVVVSAYPWAAIVLIQGPIIVLWSNTRRQSELVVARTRETTDALTGLPNRRGYQQQVDPLFQQSDTIDSTTCAVLVLDLDNFKRVNDTYGHSIGDEVLVLAAEAVRSESSAVGTGLYAARFGGEEFVIVGTGEYVAEMPNIAERVRVSILERIREWGSSASIGVAFSQSGDRTPDAMMERADEAMYVAKTSGKNCVVVHGDDRWNFTANVARAADDIRMLRTHEAAERLSVLLATARENPDWNVLAEVWATTLEAQLVCGEYALVLAEARDMVRSIDDAYAAPRGRAAMVGALAALMQGLPSEAVELASVMESVSARVWPDLPAARVIVHGAIMYAYGTHHELSELLHDSSALVVHTPWTRALIARLALSVGERSCIQDVGLASDDLSPLEQELSAEVETIISALAHDQVDAITEMIQRWESLGRRFDADHLRQMSEYIFRADDNAGSDASAA